MLTRGQVLEALKGVNDPEIHKSLIELDMIKDVQVDGKNVTVEVLLTIKGCPLKDTITRDITDAVKAIGAEDVKVIMGAMTDEQRAALTQKLRGGRQRLSPLTDKSARTRIIGVASGKGGVGKSTTTVNLAIATSRLGYKVGVLDADIYGYSIPRMLGLSGQPTIIDERTIMPMQAHGLSVISMGSLVPGDTPVIWRGPMLGKVLDQFLNDVHWGTDLDFLYIDLPPGTGDVQMSLAQMIPRMQLVVVTTPQPVAARVAIRSAGMAEKMNQPVLGVIENMSYFLCSNCDQPHHIFGEGGGEALARELGVPLFGKVPLNTTVREASDAGEPVALAEADSPAGQVFTDIAKALIKKVPVPIPLTLA